MGTHWKKLTNPNYLGSWDFEPNEERILTIDKVIKEQVIDLEKGGSAKKDCTIAHFLEECRPMVLNKTNCKTISSIHNTPIIEEWANKKIKVHVERVRAFGKLEDGLRVMKEVPKPQSIKCEECGQPIIGTGGYTAEQVVATTRARYKKSLCAECSKKRKGKEDDGAK